MAGASMTSDGGKKNLKVFFVLTSVTKSCYLHARDLIFPKKMGLAYFFSNNKYYYNRKVLVLNIGRASFHVRCCVSGFFLAIVLMNIIYSYEH